MLNLRPNQKSDVTYGLISQSFAILFSIAIVLAMMVDATRSFVHSSSYIPALMLFTNLIVNVMIDLIIIKRRKLNSFIRIESESDFWKVFLFRTALLFFIGLAFGVHADSPGYQIYFLFVISTIGNSISNSDFSGFKEKVGQAINIVFALEYLAIDIYRNGHLPNTLEKFGVFAISFVGLILAGQFVDLIGRKYKEALKKEVALKEELDAQRKRYETAFSMAQLGTWEFDVKSGSIYWSEQTYRIHDYPLNLPPPNFEQLLELYAPESREPLVQAVQAALADGTPYNFKINLITPMGERRVGIATGVPKFDGEGRVYALQGNLINITKQEDDSLKLKLAMDAVGIGVWDFNFSTDEIKLDQRSSQMVGLSSEGKIKLQEWLNLIHLFDRKTVAQMFESVRSGQTSFNVTFRVQKTNGQLSYIRATADVELASDDKAIRMTGVNWDISDEVEADNRLKETLNTIDASAIVSETDSEGTIIRVNSLFSEISGYSEEELIGKNHRLINSGVHPKEFFIELWFVISNGKTWTGEICNRAKDGKLYWVHSVISPITDASGNIIRYLSVRYDITAQKNAHLQLEQASKMSSLGEMAGGIAHEINNPLAIISSRAFNLKRKVIRGEFEPETFIKDFAVIEKTIERIAKIIRGLRSASRNSEKDPMQIVTISSLIEETAELCKDRCRTADIELILQIELGLTSSCREAQISQIVMNLIGNSIDAIFDKPERWIKVIAKRVDQCIQVVVMDSGKGIPSEILDKIMQPFFTTKEVGKGTGLGLSISAAIAKEHGGSLAYELLEGHTAFVLQLPLAKAQAEDPAKIA